MGPANGEMNQAGVRTMSEECVKSVLLVTIEDSRVNPAGTNRMIQPDPKPNQLSK